MYVNGFQGTSVDRVVARTRLTKGAVYHIFPNKFALGYAVVDEVVAAMIRAQWVTPLDGVDDCLEVIARSFEIGAAELARMPVHYGCPLNNLAQEMSALDAGFKTRVERIFDMWISSLEAALERGKALGVVRSELASRDAAILIVTLVEGILSLAKSSQEVRVLESGARNIRAVVASFRAPPEH
jgi:AcrR family transcriptional regulator